MISRPRLTYANVTSTLALFVALGGSAYAGHGEVYDGSDVIDGTLTGADIRGSFPDSQQGFIDGSLTTEDIANGTLFPVDIADNSLGSDDIAAGSIAGSDIAGGSIGGGHIAGGAVNGGHVANDSLDGFDVNDLSGADVIDGSLGRDDLAQDARGFSQTVERLGRKSLDRGDRERIIAQCPEGWSVTGGGFSNDNGRDPDDIVIQASHRFGARGWIVVAKHVGGRGAPRIQVVALAECAR